MGIGSFGRLVIAGDVWGILKGLGNGILFGLSPLVDLAVFAILAAAVNALAFGVWKASMWWRARRLPAD